jgi:D-beta-D-heptose 7-phosphate kinase/D-beta-D-heptose 1-phosphate adenosyltransferase
MVLVTRAGEVSHIPARPQRAVDVVGAGDTAVAAFAVQLAMGSTPPAAAQFANDAAGIAVGRPGAHAVPRQELATDRGSESRPSKQVTWVEAQAISRSVQQAGRVVVTNGCFDLLHPGHLHLLREARGHGDLLVVAVNDDASVRRLKGEGRPVMRLEHRMAALAAYDEVDLLVSFSSERELLDLIELLQPDGLVKGADRRPEEIAGRDIVERRGGRIVLVDLFGRWSTTELLTSVVSPPSIAG